MRFPYDLLDRFHAVACRTRASTWQARCPAHKDVSPSLSLWIGRDGRLMIGCWAGCDKGRILASKGLKMGDLFPPQTADAYGKERNALPPRRIVETYGYLTAEGGLAYEVVRYEPKDFRQRRPKPGGGWLWSLEGVRLVPYRLPELLAAPRCLPVLCVEGERKCDALRALGFVATTGCGGCGMGWQPQYSVTLAGRRVVVLPDNNAAGVRHAFLTCGSLLAHGAGSVRLVPLPELGPNEDVHDALKRGMCKEELILIINTFPEWRPN